MIDWTEADRPTDITEGTEVDLPGALPAATVAAVSESPNGGQIVRYRG